MSYILDALKKSEAQRHAGKVPTAVAPQGVSIESPRASRIGMLGWFALVLVVALGIAWGARQYFDRPPGEAAVLPAAGPQAAATLAAARPAKPAPAAPIESPKGGEAIPRLKLASSLPAREQPAAPVPGEPAKRFAQPSQAAPSSLPTRQAPAAGPVRGAVLPYTDLPPAIRQALPPLVVGGFAAGESGGTMVMVDDKLVREGDEVAPGIRVEKVLSDTAEFSYKGYRFRR